MFLITVVVSLSIFSATSAQTCAGAGASCIDSTFNMLCTCPAGTSCAPGAGGSFFCQYSFCLPDTMFCDGNIGVCCSGKCEQLAGAAFKTCTAVTATTTTTTVTTTTTTTPVTTTTQAPIQIIIATATTTTPAPTCSTPCKFPFVYNGVVHYACTNAGGFKNPWCSTKTDAFGKHVIGNYADCGVGCPVEILG